MNSAENSTAAVFEDGQMDYFPVSSIHEDENYNPRKYFDADKQAELDASVKANGIAQPIVIRPHDALNGHFYIIAGHRRYRSAVNTGLTEVPAVVRVVDRRQAMVLTAIENHHREDMSPAEEAMEARRMIDACNGDKAEASRLLGWPKNKFESRLLLLHADQSVLDAFSDRKILLGHAELLSTMPHLTQRGTLKAIIEKGVTVEELKRKLSAFSLDLASGIFDKAGCQGCPHNSSSQAELFSEHLAEGRCANVECFNEKTASRLKTLRTEIADQYNCVFLDTEKSPDSYTLLMKKGSNGVGPDQFSACKGCAHFGAMVDSTPGQWGNVTEELCFNLTCHSDKVAAYQLAIAESLDEGEIPNPGDSASSTANSKKKTAKKKAKADTTPPAVVAEADKFFRSLAGDVVSTDIKLVRAISLHAMKVMAGKSGALRETISSEYDTSEDDYYKKIQALAIGIAKGEGTSGVVADSIQMVQSNGISLAGCFVLDEDFLKSHVKSGIEALLVSAKNPEGESFAEWLCRTKGNDKAFKQFMANSKPDLIKAVLSSEFDFSMFVPTCCSERLGSIAV